MMNRNFSTADTTTLDVYYTLTEGNSLPTLPVSAIWSSFSHRNTGKEPRMTGRMGR